MNMNQAVNSTNLGILEIGGIFTCFTSPLFLVWWNQWENISMAIRKLLLHFLKRKDSDKFLVHDEPWGQKAFCFSPDPSHPMGWISGFPHKKAYLVLSIYFLVCQTRAGLRTHPSDCHFCNLLFLFSLAVVSDSVTPWTVAQQAPLSVGIFQARILEWVALPSSMDLPSSGTESVSLIALALWGRFLITLATWEASLPYTLPQTAFDTSVSKVKTRNENTTVEDIFIKRSSIID